MDVSGGLSLVQFVIEKLGSPIWTKIEALLGLECELDKLRQTMSTIEAVLLDVEVEERLHQAYRTYVERNKLQRLKEALYRADDLFDEITTLAHLNKLMPCNNNKVCSEVCLFFSCSNQFRSAFTWSQEMKKISEMLDDIVKDHRYDIGSRHPAGFDAAKQMRIDRETHSYVCEDDVMIGREDDKRKVIDMLLNTPVEQQDGFVVSIVGIGGLGKTTLARQVYNDDMIVKEFPRKLWVCVSDDFNVKALVAQILAAVNPLIKLDQMKLEELQMNLRKELDGKRYLLVLDDVWNEDSNKWLELRNVLIGGGRISGIVVTTRSKRVAEVVGSCYTHTLMGLSEDESLELLGKMALKPEEYPMKPQLVDIGKQIVQKCANVPLAIRVVGSLLRGQDESKWENLKNTDLANIVQDESNGIIPVLKISYNYLPFHLKSCFSYCAVFPKDYNIIKEDLICLWMAQGFIISSDGESFEDVGEEYFKQLLQRCFFQDVEQAEDTEDIVSCKMHDLIHDLAKEVAGTDILSCTYRPRCFNEKTRHVYMDGSTPKDVVGKLSNMQRMRTFLCTKDRGFSLKPFVGGLSNVKYLRVLRLNDCSGLDKLPSGIGELVHLRYLDLSYNEDLCVLPSSITKLYNLQTLKLCDCENLKGLPRELGKLVNLRHLDIDGCSSLTHMPPGMNSMTSLQKLTMFVVGGSATSNAAWSWRSTDGVGQLEDLDGFTNYTRTMHIIILKNVRYNAVVGRGMLLKSPKLLEIKYNWETEENNNAEELLQGLQPCSKLRRLELLDYPGVRLPNWMMTFSLKVLEFKGLSEVEYMENKSSNINSGHGDKLVFFPSLEKLKLEKMAKLKGWWKPSSSESGESDRIPQAPLLSKLYVSDCPYLTTLFLGSSMNLKSCLPNLAEIEIRNCERLEHLPLMSQLRHLKVLELSGLSEVEYMESSSINSGDDDELVFFPSLEKLKLEKMAKLKGWWKPSSSESGEIDRIPQAPLLSKLYVSDCPNLTTLFLGSSMNLKSCLPNLAEIEIRNCERLEHLPMMSQLRHLKVLELHYLEEVEYMESNINSGDDDELVFFPSLEKLKLENMAKLKGWWKPSSSESGESDWIPQAPVLSELYVSYCPNLFLGAPMNLNSCFPNLAEIDIRNCKWQHLPMMSQLRHLKVLVLYNLKEVEYMESSSINSGDDNELVFFPSLEKLCLEDMPKLKGWWKSSSESELEKRETPQAPKLSHLKIRTCPELKTFPLCPGLQQLHLRDFNKALGPIMKETTQQKEEGRHGSLREVWTDNLPYLINSLPVRDSNLQKMEGLKTGEVGEVFRSGRLSSLRSLEIWGCDNLKSISGRGVWDQFTALESLTLHFLPELELEDEDNVINNTEEGSDAEMPWRYLAPTLRSLTLFYLPKVVKLPKGIGCLSSLHSLRIWDCHNLESLTPSIGGLSSLQSLTIIGCSKLKRLPEEMRHLTSLTKLHIWGCSPELTKECKNKTGANWFNIQHIPDINLD